MRSEIAKVILKTELPGKQLFWRGKCRDTWIVLMAGGRGLANETHPLLMVATDRISAFDVVLPTGVPEKGKILT